MFFCLIATNKDSLTLWWSWVLSWYQAPFFGLFLVGWCSMSLTCSSFASFVSRLFFLVSIPTLTTVFIHFRFCLVGRRSLVTSGQLSPPPRYQDYLAFWLPWSLFLGEWPCLSSVFGLSRDNKRPTPMVSAFLLLFFKPFLRALSRRHLRCLQQWRRPDLWTSAPLLWHQSQRWLP